MSAIISGERTCVAPHATLRPDRHRGRTTEHTPFTATPERPVFLGEPLATATPSAPNAPAIDITRNFIKAKRPCADGYRWFLRRQETGSGYQQLLDDLVRDGRVSDACWLLDQFGPTDDVLHLESLDADALVFAGTVHCSGNGDVSGVLRTGRSLRVERGLHVGGAMQIGADLRVGGALRCEGAARIGSDARIEWGATLAQDLACDGLLRVGWDIECAASVRVGADTAVGQGLRATGDFSCAGRVRIGNDLDVGGAIDVGRGIEVLGSVACKGHLQVGWGICAAGSIEAACAIRAGESLHAGESIRCGDDYGIFAGLAVPMHAWDSSARVKAAERPERLISGCWSPA